MRIQTREKEIYSKFNMLNISSEIILKNITSDKIEKILKNINKKEKILEMEKAGNYWIVKRVNSGKICVYLRA